MARAVQYIAVSVVFVLLATILFASGPAERLLRSLAQAGTEKAEAPKPKTGANLAAADDNLFADPAAPAKGDKDKPPKPKNAEGMIGVVRKMLGDVPEDELHGEDRKDMEQTLDEAEDIFLRQKRINQRNIVEAGRQLRVRQCERLNVLLIVLDDVGFGELGCYGQQMIKTPYIDDFSKRCIRFTQFYAGSSQDVASRGTLMSARHTGRGEQHRDEWITVRKTDFTLPKIMYAGGFDTGYMGKWSMGNAKFAGTPQDHQVRHFYGLLTPTEAEDVFPDHVWRNESKVELLGNKDGKREQYFNDLITDEAIAFLKSHSRYRRAPDNQTQLAHQADREFARNLTGETPFFLTVSFSMPVSGEGADIPGDMGNYGDTNWSQPRKNYASMITGVDKLTGKILAALQRLDLDDHTIVVLTSDNGPRTNDVVDTQFFDTTGQLRGQQVQLFEGAIRVPLLIRDPGRGQRGGFDSRRIFAMWDLPLTLASMAQCRRIPREVDGKVIPDAVNEWNYELAQASKSPSDEMLYWEVRQGELAQAVRVNNWKAVRVGAKGAWQLFDLATDVAESKDVAGDHPDEIRKIDEFAARAQAPPAMARRGEEE